MTIEISDPLIDEEERGFFTFKPRPNRPEHYDEQSAFVDSNDPGVSFLIGGNGAGTTLAAAFKLARFVLFKQPPPRFDTPFWIIGPDFEQTIESFWKEKLQGWGFIPEYEIDWDRVTWHDKRRALPRTIPLLPWVDGDPHANWTLEFRSSDQGRIAQQAREIGGFCLTEQFPWDILVETLRGMRRHNFPGGKFCEFTPIDPVLSAPLKEMMEQNKLPVGWAIYRANTRCNVDDPNSEVTKAWYDEFFGMVGDDMRDTREIGAWATYKGLMYKEFNPKVHVFPNAKMDEWPIPINAVHKRTIDWGTGPHNAFCFDAETEVLTVDGWRKFPDYAGEKVATVNCATKQLEFQMPTGTIKKHYMGKLYVCEPKREGVNFAVTENHRMVVTDRKRHVWEFKEIQDLNLKRYYYIPRSYAACVRDDDRNELFTVPVTFRSRQLPPIRKEAFARFLGLWLAEGDSYRSKGGKCVRITNGDQLDEVKRVLDATGWNWQECVHAGTGCHVFTLSSNSLLTFLENNDAIHKSRFKRIPRFILSWGIGCLQALLEGLMLGDGSKTHFRPDGTRGHSEQYHTTSKQLADDVCELLALLGRPTNVSVNQVQTQWSKAHVMYTVRFVNVLGSRLDKLPIKTRDYDGMVYCVEVPNGTLVVRRGGKTMVCGNCVLWFATHQGTYWVYDEYWTVESNTHEDRLRDVHRKDGWDLKCVQVHPQTRYELVPIPGVPQRWKYDNPYFQQTYGPPDDPGMFRECEKYMLPVARMSLGPYSYNPSVELLQGLFGSVKKGVAPRLFIAKKCTNLIRELSQMRWQDPTMKSVNPKDPKPSEVDKDNHSPSALRGGLWSDMRARGQTLEGFKVEPKHSPHTRHRR